MQAERMQKSPKLGNGEWFEYSTSGLSLNQMFRENPDLFYYKPGLWWHREYFADDVSKPRRLRLWTEAAEGSFGLNFQDQQALQLKWEEVPTARDLVDGMIQYFHLTGERIFPGYYVRTTTMTSFGEQVIAGAFNEEGLYLTFWKHYNPNILGLATCEPLKR